MKGLYNDIIFAFDEPFLPRESKHTHTHTYIYIYIHDQKRILIHTHTHINESMVSFYIISTIVGYSMPSPVYTHVSFINISQQS